MHNRETGRVSCLTSRNSEAHLITIELTVGDHVSSVISRDDTVYTLLPTPPALLGSLDIERHLETRQ
jgi:hypothetical protein